MFLILSYFSKVVHKVTRKLRKGSGYTLPGYLILKLFPNILRNSKIKFKKGLILVSGTNGKTTTSKIVTHLLEYKGASVLHNKSGANLLSGVVSTVFLESNWRGNLDYDYGVFEVDEFTLPLLLKYLSPDVLVLLNLSRDQLDRYGETDIILEKWQKAFSLLSSRTKIVYPESEFYFSVLDQAFSGDVVQSGSGNHVLAGTSLKGKYNDINAGIALTTLGLIGLPCSTEEALVALSGFSVAYGRGETLHYEGKRVTIHLAKNPVSFNHNMEVLSDNVDTADVILFILNDNIPDGRDVSWIYDIDALLIKKACDGKHVIVSGKRALDMAVRLHYADVDIQSNSIIPDVRKALYKALSGKHEETVLVYPNYSAMLETRQLLLGKKIL